MYKAHIRTFQPECPGDSKGRGYSEPLSAHKATELVNCSCGDDKMSGKRLNRFRDLRRTLVLVAEAASSTQLPALQVARRRRRQAKSRQRGRLSVTFTHTYFSPRNDHARARSAQATSTQLKRIDDIRATSASAASHAHSHHDNTVTWRNTATLVRFTADNVTQRRL